MDPIVDSTAVDVGPLPDGSTDDVVVNERVDELFDEKMRQLRELGLLDDRMMDKVNAINGMSDAKNVVIDRPKHIRPNAIGNHFYNEERIEFKGDSPNAAGEGGFQPIANSTIKWSLPFARRRRSPSPDRDHAYNNDTYRDRDRNRDYNRNRERDRDNEDRSSGSRSQDGYDVKVESSIKAEIGGSFGGHSLSDVGNGSNSHTSDVPKHRPMPASKARALAGKTTNQHKCFESLFDKKQTVEKKKTDVITDIDAFIKDCNKKAEKPKPLILDDIDDFIANANKRLEALYGTSSSSKGQKRKHK